MNEQKTKTMKAILLSVGGKAQVVELPVENQLEAFYTHLGVETIDIAERKVGNKYFDLICDDNGLFKEWGTLRCTAILNKNNCEEYLCGNVLITNHDDEGRTTGLSDDDIKLILSHIFSIDQHKMVDDTYCLTFNYKGFGPVAIQKGTQFLVYTL